MYTNSVTSFVKASSADSRSKRTHTALELGMISNTWEHDDRSTTTKQCFFSGVRTKKPWQHYLTALLLSCMYGDVPCGRMLILKGYIILSKSGTDCEHVDISFDCWTAVHWFK